MTVPSPSDAKARAVVRLSDGRTARLLSVPIPSEVRLGERRSSGRKAKVMLGSGAVLSVPLESLSLV